MLCEYYVLCDHEADGTTDHPLLGKVPTCSRCAKRHDLTLTPFLGRTRGHLSHSELLDWHDYRDTL